MKCSPLYFIPSGAEPLTAAALQSDVNHSVQTSRETAELWPNHYNRDTALMNSSCVASVVPGKAGNQECIY